MRVLAINQFYPPDHAATSQLLGELCEDLVRAGDKVTVVASQGTYLGTERLPAREERAGVHVVRPWATSLGKATKLHRMSDYLSFWATGILAVARAQRPEVILTLTTPPMIAAGAVSVGALRGVPVVCWVQDVYPEVAAAFGVLPETARAYRALHALAAATHQGTTRVVALSDGMAERLVGQRAPRERLRVVQNWADGRMIRPIPHSENPFRAEHGLLERFVLMYSGNIGEGHDVATFVDAARRLRQQRPEVLLLFVGEGSRKKEAERLARGMDNVRFLPYQPKERLAESLSAADLHLISLRAELDGLLVPSKLYGALASGRPLCYVGPPGCEVARVIRGGELGWEGRPGDAQGLADAVLRLAEPGRWVGAGRAARALFEAEFDRPHAVRRWRGVLAEAAGARHPRPH
ncbi:MAG: glycosyltransferase family 4 protein [Myxococcales bacterium]|nr:glycosyltransferase family 4 protein [Myxococcales bacterium]